MSTADLLVINRTDLAPFVGADLSVMQLDARAKRGELSMVFTSLRNEPDAASVAKWVRERIAAAAG